MTLAEARGILESAGVESPRFEAQLLFALALGISRTTVLAGTYASPTGEQKAEFVRLITERAKRIPLAYLRGTQEFYALEFEVSPAVLVPRPETELLVEEALTLILSPHRASPFYMADVGTGSGCIPISVAKYQPDVHVVAFDISSDALAIAQGNAIRHKVTERVRFVQSDLLTGAATELFDLIVSNPPYIAAEKIPTLQSEVRDHEPRLALNGGAEGLEIYRRLIGQAVRALKPEGWLYVEVGQGQAETVKKWMHTAGLLWPRVKRDLAGIERVVEGRKIKPE